MMNKGTTYNSYIKNALLESGTITTNLEDSD